MGSCLSKSASSDRNNKHSKGKVGTSTSGESFDGSSTPADNRPVLRQQPRRKSVEGHLAPVPQREGPVDPRKQNIAATQSQVDFFKLLDEKIEQGGSPPRLTLSDGKGMEGQTSQADVDKQNSVHESQHDSKTSSPSAVAPLSDTQAAHDGNSVRNEDINHLSTSAEDASAAAVVDSTNSKEVLITTSEPSNGKSEAKKSA